MKTSNKLVDLSKVGGVITHKHLELSKEAKFEDICKFGKAVSQLHESSLFWVGDLVNHARKNHGKKYKMLAEIMGYERQSLVNIAFVCAHIHPNDRIDGVSFTHHREVVKLGVEDRAFFLNEAAKHKWSLSQLRKAVNLKLAPYAAENKGAKKDSSFSIVKSLNDNVRWFRKEMSKTPLAKWSPARRRALAQDLYELECIRRELLNGVN